MQKISEAQIEKKVTEHAKKAGWLSYKWVSPSQRWVPARLYFKNGQVKMIEFKAPGKFPTRGQAIIHKILRREGLTVHVIDTVEKGVALFEIQEESDPSLENPISSFPKTEKSIPWQEKTGYTEENQVSPEKATKK